ncbi:MAG: NUDIX domain-containing protein [Proteobacteria bacterium]|jgi:8-oxo-dGTP diphosphatase|nr:NUDIX domain-containing protein [Pseudomonadota bacterium]
MAKIIRAVAGVLRKDNLVLMAQRPQDKSHAGYWEFPGGKIEADESTFEALIRELKEEIGVDVRTLHLTNLISITQSYPHGDVYLDVVLVNCWDGEVSGLEGQALYWQNIDQACVQYPLLLTTEKIFEVLRS